MIRIGTISKIDYKEGTVSIVQEERDDAVSFDLPMLSEEYNPPNVGDMVIVAYPYSDYSEGFMIGKPFNYNNLPTRGEKGIIRKDYDIDAFIEYDKATKTLTVQAEKIVFKGNVLQGGE